MSQRFMRCAHCGMPHDVLQAFCPATGKPMERIHKRSEHFVAAAKVPSVPAPQIQSSIPPPQRDIPTAPPGRGGGRNLIGKKISDKYMVRAVLGEGGMGTVYEAEHIAIGRAVAVKVLHPQQARKKDAVRRFHQEARAAGAIGHPNICEVYDIGLLDDGSPYLVMERLVGETLADRIGSEGGLPFDDVIDVLTQVLSGLVAAHEKRIVHRDIKPENVFLTRRVGCPPVAKLLDFGVSKMIGPLFSGEREEDLDLTRTGMVMGTPYYMSPEQARGDRNLDARVDLYACGVILYEALTGRRPFMAANYNALLLQILTSRPRAARELRPALPSGFDAVLDKSLARSRDDRYQTAADFQRDLQTLRDKYTQGANSVPIAAAVSELSRLAPPKMPVAEAAHLPARVRAPRAPTPPNLDTVPPPPVAPRRVVPRPVQVARAAAPPPPPPPQPEVPEAEPSSNSVDIPITFSSETPISGAHHMVDGRDASRDIPAHLANAQPTTTDVDPPPDSGSDFEDVPTEVQESPLRRPHTNDDEHTTQRRGSELGAALAAKAAEADGGATEVWVGRIVPRTIPAAGRPPGSRSSSPPDETETLVKSELPMRRRTKPRTPSSADDTIEMHDEMAAQVRAARDRPESNAGKPHGSKGSR
jgi:eukaryotic-like serine/threonine-protein kinase